MKTSFSLALLGFTEKDQDVAYKMTMHSDGKRSRPRRFRLSTFALHQTVDAMLVICSPTWQGSAWTDIQWRGDIAWVVTQEITFGSVRKIFAAPTALAIVYAPELAAGSTILRSPLNALQDRFNSLSSVLAIWPTYKKKHLGVGYWNYSNGALGWIPNREKANEQLDRLLTETFQGGTLTFDAPPEVQQWNR